jgi:hypothetical protein
MPHLDGNWLGVYPTAYPEKYSTLQLDKDDNVTSFVNKSTEGYDNAFIGLSSIWDYEIFWSELETNMKSGEIVSAFEDISKYSGFKAKHLKWLDTGNLDDLNRTKEHFNDNPLSLYKVTDEITYKANKFIKFVPNKDINKNKSERAIALKDLIPSEFVSTDNFISYNWEPGNTLYHYDSSYIYNRFLEKLRSNIIRSEKYHGDKELFDKSDIFIVEICSRKNYKCNNFYLHHLCVDPRFSYYYNQTPAAIKNNCKKINQTDEEIEQDLLEIRDLLAPRKMIVVSHYNSKMNGEYIPARASLIDLLEAITKKHNIPFVNPTEVLKEYPQNTIMSDDLGHYFEIGQVKVGEYINEMIKGFLEKP